MTSEEQRSLKDVNIDDLGQLIKIAAKALPIKPPNYIRSILGHSSEWLPRRHGSEFGLANLYRPIQTANLGLDLTVPGLPLEAPPRTPPLLKRLFWRPSRILFSPDHNQNPTTFPDEAWFFINGICTNETVARTNAGYLSKMFHRPFQIIQNATDGAVVDLLECVIGKGTGVMTEPARVGYPAILAALRDPHKKRVVVICHSQGTIIMSNILRALKDPSFKCMLYAEGSRAGGEQCDYVPDALEDPALLKKLEIYAFANCATTMTRVDGKNYPHIESYGNENDIVARLGCLSPDQSGLGIRIDGETYHAKDKWGHLLNAHYLFGIYDHLTGKAQNPYRAYDIGKSPRLYEYFQGKKPVSDWKLIERRKKTIKLAS